MAHDSAPTFTIYRMSFRDESGSARTISGVLGGLEVVDQGAGGVLPHERVTPKASTDRLDLTRATSANLSPIWGLSLASGLTQLLAGPAELIATVDAEGVRHVVERVSDPERIEAIATCVAADDVLVADGHHRYGVAQIYRDEARAAGGPDDAEDTLAFVNELVADQLSVAAIHRLYHAVALDELVAALDRYFERSPIGDVSAETLGAMERDGFLVLIAPGGASRLSPRSGALDEVRANDGAWLEHAVADLAPEVSYQHGLQHVAGAVRDGTAVAGVLIRPVSVAEIERTARERLLMPPKSTFFVPKLLTGLVVRTMR
jgi:uncharacterized protein (DUF1015 family)